MIDKNCGRLISRMIQQLIPGKVLAVSRIKDLLTDTPPYQTMRRQS